MALQLAVARQAETLVGGLAFGVVLPSRRGAFVAADVEVFAREELHQFFENVLRKLYRVGVGHVHHVVVYAAVALDYVRAVGRAAKFGVGCEGGAEVAGHIDFWDDGDVTLSGVGHHVLNLVLRIIVRTVRLVYPVLRKLVHIRKAAVGRNAAHARELRVLLYLHAPSLVVAQVPVEGVHFVVRHHVDHALHLFYREEVARHVEHKAAVLKSRLVGNVKAGQGVGGDGCVLHARHHVGGEQFLDALESVEHSQGVLRLHRHARAVDGQRVGFVLGGAAGELLHAEQSRVVAARHRDGCARDVAVKCCKSVDFGYALFVHVAVADGERVGQVKRAAVHVHRLGTRGEVDKGLRHGGGPGQENQRKEQSKQFVSHVFRCV